MGVPITNMDPRHSAMIYRGTGQDIEFVRELGPLQSAEFEPGHFYWADTTRVSFDAIDAAVARAWERTEPAHPQPSAGAKLLRKALQEAA